MFYIQKQQILVIFCFIIFFSGCTDEFDYLIIPSSKVGAITPKATEVELRKIYGNKNVKLYEVDVGEGDVVEGTIVFPNTNKELTIEWKSKHKDPERITIYRADTKWITNNGITIGTTLEEMEKINGGIFKLTGFGWDYPGRTVSWEQGNLPIQLQLDLDPDVKLSDKELMQVSGDSYFSSNNPIIKKMKLKVVRMHILWDI